MFFRLLVTSLSLNSHGFSYTKNSLTTKIIGPNNLNILWRKLLTLQVNIATSFYFPQKAMCKQSYNY